MTAESDDGLGSAVSAATAQLRDSLRQEYLRIHEEAGSLKRIDLASADRDTLREVQERARRLSAEAERIETVTARLAHLEGASIEDLAEAIGLSAEEAHELYGLESEPTGHD